MKHNKYPKLFEKGYIGNLKSKKIELFVILWELI